MEGWKDYFNEKKWNKIIENKKVFYINNMVDLGWDERIGLAVEYVKQISFIADCKIIFQTIAKVLRRSDIASGEELVMQDLDVERGNK